MKKLFLILSFLLTNLIYSQQASKVNNAQNVYAAGQPRIVLSCDTLPSGVFRLYPKSQVTWPFGQLTSKPTTLLGYGITDALPLADFTWGNLAGKPSFATVATSGNYNDLSNQPTIPTNNNQLTNSAGYLIASDVSGAYVPITRTVNGYALSSNISLLKGDVGLGNVDNTSDLNKPISTATQTALNGKQATLVSGTTIKTLETQSLLGTGNIDLTKSDVGLSNVDNTSDINKPISIATQTALDNKVDKVTGKQLSTEDYTSAEKTKLSGIQAGAEINVNADWNAVSGDAQILNKPVVPTNNNQLTNGNNYVDAAGARGSISLTTSGSTGTASYSSSTGVLNIPNYAPTNAQILSALGYTPYSAANPNGYITASSTDVLTNKSGNISQWTNNSGYVNQAGARTAISLTTVGTSGASTYDNLTGILNIPNYNVYSPTFNNTAVKTINAAGVQISTTKNTRVSYTVTHTIALTLLLSSGSSMVFLEISPNNSTWTSISQAGFSDAVAVAVALNKTSTNNVQGEVPSGWYVRLRAVTSGAGSAAFTVGQEVQY